jgi:mono/diheme cytochrome c family protein
MKLKLFAAAVAASFVVALTFVSAAQAPKADATKAAVPTFTKDVAPILYANCVTCHRPGEIGPMSLLTYEDARPYAQAILEEVGQGHMPPWHAEAPEGTLLKWAGGGAPKGNPADMPKVPVFAEGWQLGQPDAVFQMSEPYSVPASGTINYEYFYLPTNFTEPKWIQSIEVRPGVRAAVHHVLVFYRSSPDRTQPAVLSRNAEQNRTPAPLFGSSPPHPPATPTERQRLIASYAPGTNPQVMPAGTALRLEAGGSIEIQVHYTAFGEAVKDRTKVGLIFSKEADPREVRPAQFLNAQLELQAGAKDVKVDADLGFVADATIWGIFPHTHLRGTRWQYVLQLPDGTKKIVLDVPRYDFQWQTYYMFKEPLEVPKGSKLISSAWYDNSVTNKANPDPKVSVKWGDQTWEEMQYTGLLFSPAIKK